MALGLVNAPAVWSRFIDTALSQYRWDFILTYMDDILVYTKGTIDEHIAHLEKLFDKLDEHGIKIKASKLILARKELPYLGMLISTTGIRPDPMKTRAVKDMPFPSTLKLLRSAVGMFSYYRRFIPKFTDIASPLYEMTKQFKNNKKDGNKRIVANKDAVIAFEKLKDAITSEPITLSFPV